MRAKIIQFLLDDSDKFAAANIHKCQCLVLRWAPGPHAD